MSMKLQLLYLQYIFSVPDDVFFLFFLFFQNDNVCAIVMRPSKIIANVLSDVSDTVEHEIKSDELFLSKDKAVPSRLWLFRRKPDGPPRAHDKRVVYSKRTSHPTFSGGTTRWYIFNYLHPRSCIAR